MRIVKPLYSKYLLLSLGSIVALSIFVMVFTQAETQSTNLYEHNGIINSIMLSYDNKYIASSGEDGRVVVWDIEQSRIYRELAIDGNQVYSIAWSPQSNRIAICVGGHEVLIWNIVENTTNAMSEVNDCFNGLSWLNKNTIATNKLETLYLTSESLVNIENDLYPTLIWDSWEGILAMLTSSNTTQIVDLHGNELLEVLTEGDVTSILWHPDGVHLAISDSDNNVDIWNVDTQEIVQSLSHQFAVNAIYWDRQGEKLVVTTGDLSLVAGDFQIHLYTFPDTTRVSVIDIPRDIVFGEMGLAWSTDSSFLAISFEPDPNLLEWSSEVWIIDSTSGKTLDRIELPVPVTALVWTSNFNMVIGRTDGSVEIWQTS